MSDPRLDEDALLRTAFGDLYRRGAPHVRPAGVPAAQGRARQRRRRQIAGYATLLVVLLAIPTVAFAAVGRSGRAAPPPASPPVTATAGPSVTASPTGSPSARPTGPDTAVVAGAGELADATLTIDWTGTTGQLPPCQGGAVTFQGGTVDGSAQGPPQRIVDVGHADVDANGVVDVVALLVCQFGEASTSQIVVFTPTGPGAFSTLGVVINAPKLGASPRFGYAPYVHGFTLSADGLITADVADLLPCCSTPPTWAMHQTRVYAWRDGAFRQTAGPASFLADKTATRLTITSPTLAFGPLVSGHHTAELTVGVRNDGPRPAADVTVVVDPATAVQFDDRGHRCTTDAEPICSFGTIAPGQTATLDLGLTTFDDLAPSQPADLELRVGDQFYSATTVPVTSR